MMRVPALTLSILLTLALLSFGQTYQGSISGSVQDSSGAVIPAVKITVVNSSTGLARETITSEGGDFSVPGLPLGLYSLTLTKDGFQTQRIDKVEVEVSKTTNVAAKLSIAQQQAIVEVAAAAATLETTSSTLASVVGPRMVQDLPVGRFLTRDVLEEDGDDGASSHRYLYTRVDPVNESDPTGYSRILSFGPLASVAPFLASQAQRLGLLSRGGISLGTFTKPTAEFLQQILLFSGRVAVDRRVVAVMHAVKESTGEVYEAVSVSSSRWTPVLMQTARQIGLITVNGAYHAEVNLVNWALRNNLTIVSLGTGGRPVCAACQQTIRVAEEIQGYPIFWQ